MRKVSILFAVLSSVLLLVPSAFACGDCGVTITKEPLYCGYTLPDGTWVDSAPTSGLMLNTVYEWYVYFNVTNLNAYPVTDVVVKDRFGAEFGVELMEYSGGSEPVLTTKGASDKVFLTWELGTGGPGARASMVLRVYTDINPAGRQEFTSCGTSELNSGAVVKWRDNMGRQHSAETLSILVSTIGVAESPCP